MKIREYSIRRYGPLHDTGRVVLSNFTLIFGHNEDGKTLTIDALVKLLFGHATREREFSAINRVTELPDGYVILSTSKAHQLKIPEQCNLPDVVDLSPSECSNTFVIRNSNLSIPDQSTFYSTVTERLTGLRTGYIGKIVEELRAIGKITPSGMFRNVGEERLKSRIEEAHRLIEEIHSIITKSKSENIEEIDRHLVRVTNELQATQRSIELLNDARLREKYEQGKRALERLVSAYEQSKRMHGYTEQEIQQWRDFQRDIERFVEERARMSEELKRDRIALKELTDEIEKSETEFRMYEERKRRLDEVVRPLIRRYEEKVAFVPTFETRRKFFTTAGVLSGILLAISLLGIAIAPHPIMLITAAILFLILIGSGVLYYATIKKLSEIASEFQRVLHETARYNWDDKSLPRILEKIEAFEEEHRRLRDELQRRKQDKYSLQRIVVNLSDNQIPEIDRHIKVKQDEIDAIRRSSGQETIDEYRTRLREKLEYQKIMETQSALLQKDFGTANDSVNHNIDFWRDAIQRMKQYEDKAPGVVYSEQELDRLKERQRALQQELNDLQERWNTYAEQFRKIERRANEILQSGEEYVFCKTVRDLETVQMMLRDFVSSHEALQDSVLTAIKLFNEIAEDEKQKIRDLFGEQKPVSDYFRRITRGRYTEVTYDQQTGNVEVIQSDGLRLSADKLSGGAYDQLYFSIRLALGEELLKGEKGFFILDDPFIKSDEHRLRDQIQMLRRIVDYGWQVLFFSAKSEIYHELENDITDGRVTFIDYRRSNEN